MVANPSDDNMFMYSKSKLSHIHISITVVISLKVTVEDLSHMSKQTLYTFGVESFDDAKIILRHAKQGNAVRPRSSSSGNTKSKLYRCTLIV